jgi:hypothetical protein
MAIDMLENRGLPTFDADLADGGAQAFIVRFPSAQLCVRVTLGERLPTLRGYAISEALGPELALPLCQELAEIEDAVVATFPLAQVVTTRAEAWATVLDLVSTVHAHNIDPAWDLPPVDLTTGLAERFESLENSTFQAWVAPLRTEVANLDAAIRVATRHRPRVLLHGDAHAG